MIITNENGKESQIDTTFSDEISMKVFLKDHDMDAPNPPEPPMPPETIAPPEPPMPPKEVSESRKVTHHGKDVVYTYRYNYDNEEGENNNLIISFDKKDFNDLLDRLKSTIYELEKDKNISQKSLQKELEELKKSL